MSHRFSAARMLLIALLFGAPLAFGAVEAWGWATLAISTVLLFLCWAIGSVREKEISIRWTWNHSFAVLFLALGTAQLIAGQTLDRIGTREALIKLTADVLVFFLAGELFDRASGRVWHAFGIAVVLYAFAVSTLAILQFFSQPDLIYWNVEPSLRGYVFGPYVNHNHYAGLMEMLIPVGVSFLAVQSNQQHWRWILALGAIISIFSVPLSGSRAGSISVVVESVILVAVLRKWQPSRARYVLMPCVVIASSCVLFTWLAPTDVSARLQTILRSPDRSYIDRRDMALASLRMFTENAWVGVGLGSFATAYPQYQKVPTDVFVDHAHNDFAESLAETGVVGMSLILASITIFLVNIFSSQRNGLQNERQWIRLGAAVGCCGLMCHSLADFNFHIPANAAWFAFCAGIAQLS